mmetsp:Transcript_8651/g.36064  ORF Transcript_8651/g.36064 Transcript_8651/m.36064 type:complete len:201 (+) Transcript_8651:757-1359(+)
MANLSAVTTVHFWWADSACAMARSLSTISAGCSAVRRPRHSATTLRTESFSALACWQSSSSTGAACSESLAASCSSLAMREMTSRSDWRRRYWFSPPEISFSNCGRNFGRSPTATLPSAKEAADLTSSVLLVSAWRTTWSTSAYSASDLRRPISPRESNASTCIFTSSFFAWSTNLAIAGVLRRSLVLTTSTATHCEILG